MSPRNGDRKIEDGLSWVYQDPPGAWTIVPPDLPLSDRQVDFGDGAEI